MIKKKRHSAFARRIYVNIKKTLTRISPELATKIIYRVSMGRKLNLEEPDDFNQKIMWLKLNTYYNNPLVTQCADKYAVREYIKEHGCSEILNGLIDVYDSVDEIEWDNLPNQFAIKCNHGCGLNIICADKSTADKEKILNTLKEWIKTDYYLGNAEVNYKFVSKKIICEPFLNTKNGHLPNDYKIYCFDGKPQCVLVCYERDVELKLLFLDLDWNPTNIGKEGINDGEVIPKPQSFEKMIEYSKILSKGLPFVRMDFYDVDGEVVFGEMTFTPAGGLATYYSEEGLKYLGDLIKLPDSGLGE